MSENRKLKSLLLYAMLCSSIIILGACNTDGTGSGSNWHRVTSVSEIIGIWEGNFTVNVPPDGDYNYAFSVMLNAPVPASSVYYENYQVKYEENADVLCISTKMVLDQLLEDTAQFNAGHTKDSLWDNVVLYFSYLQGYINATIEKYYIEQEDVASVNDVNVSVFYLNKDNNQLKVIIPLSQKKKQEVILDKK